MIKTFAQSAFQLRPAPHLRIGGDRDGRLRVIDLGGVRAYTNDPGGARALWTPAVAAAWVPLDGAVLRCDGEVARCTAGGTATDAYVGAMRALVAAITRWDDGLVTALSALPGAAPLPPPAIGVAIPPGVSIALGDHRGRAVLIARVGFARTPTSPALATPLVEASGAALTLDREAATLRWPQVERDLRRVRAAVAALQLLAGQGDGPYR